jgi:hypothetical protein
MSQSSQHANHNESDRCAPGCDDQLPVVSRIGRGLKGDSYRVNIVNPDTACETHLEGLIFDETTKTWNSEWVSENINGGELSYQYNLRPYTIPQTFTITFIYRRPGRTEWSWTTPAIPYVWDANGDGLPDTDGIVGSGVGNLFVREGVDKPWIEKLVFPPGTTAEDYNSPAPEETWSVNLTFGVGGDINIPNLDDMAKVLGWSRAELERFLSEQSVISNSVTYKNVKEYVDKRDSLLDTTLRTDLGAFVNLPSQAGAITVKKYIDDSIAAEKTRIDAALASAISSLKGNASNTLADIVAKIYGGGTIGSDGHVAWNNSGKAAVGNIDITSGGSSSSDGLYTVGSATNPNNLNFS